MAKEYLLGQKVLVTTNNYFFAPNGRQYKALFGTLRSICDDKDSLGISTNRNSTNWYVEVGNMIIAGCQVFYMCKTDKVNFGNTFVIRDHDGKNWSSEYDSGIYNADEEYEE